MVEFNKLVWSPITKTLTIDVTVSSLSYYTNVYIDKVIIDNQDTFISTGPSPNPIYSYQFDVNTNNKTFQATLTNSDLLVSSENNIYFVYIVTKGAPSAGTPCGMDSSISTGVAIDESYIYRVGMDFLKEVNNTSLIPQDFINYILKLKAFQLCVLNKNYVLALYYWNNFLVKNMIDYSITNCNCHG